MKLKSEHREFIRVFRHLRRGTLLKALRLKFGVDVHPDTVSNYLSLYEREERSERYALYPEAVINFIFEKVFNGECEQLSRALFKAHSFRLCNEVIMRFAGENNCTKGRRPSPINEDISKAIHDCALQGLPPRDIECEIAKKFRRFISAYRITAHLETLALEVTA